MVAGVTAVSVTCCSSWSGRSLRGRFENSVDRALGGVQNPGGLAGGHAVAVQSPDLPVAVLARTCGGVGCHGGAGLPGTGVLACPEPVTAHAFALSCALTGDGTGLAVLLRERPVDRMGSRGGGGVKDVRVGR